MDRETGKIVRLTDKGYGFISREGEDKDLFFHANELEGVDFDDLREGEPVEFLVTVSDKGPNAVEVTRVEGAADAAPADDTVGDDTDESDDEGEEEMA